MDPDELWDEIELNRDALAEINAQNEAEMRERERIDEGIY
jgi:hypothetical protein